MVGFVVLCFDSGKQLISKMMGQNFVYSTFQMMGLCFGNEGLNIGFDWMWNFIRVVLTQRRLQAVMRPDLVSRVFKWIQAFT